MELNTAPRRAEQQVASSTPGAEEARDPLESYSIIVERNLFRTTDRPIAADQTDPNSLEATALQLDLYGTIAGEDGKGYAIIEERDKKRQRLYKVGDKVSGATIVKIMRNAVVLRLGEKDQVLKKKEIASTAERSSSRSPGGRTADTAIRTGSRLAQEAVVPPPGGRAHGIGCRPGEPPDPGPRHTPRDGRIFGETRRSGHQRDSAGKPV